MGEHNQRFDSFEQWANKASSWLTRHHQYNNTEHGDKKGYRGRHFTALCFDSHGRLVCNGGDFQRAHDESAFPVHWIWPDQLLELAVKHTLEGSGRTLADAHKKDPLEAKDRELAEARDENIVIKNDLLTAKAFIEILESQRDEAMAALRASEAREAGLRANLDDIAKHAHAVVKIVPRGALRPSLSEVGKGEGQADG